MDSRPISSISGGGAAALVGTNYRSESVSDETIQSKRAKAAKAAARNHTSTQDRGAQSDIVPQVRRADRQVESVDLARNVVGNFRTRLRRDGKFALDAQEFIAARCSNRGLDGNDKGLVEWRRPLLVDNLHVRRVLRVGHGQSGQNLERRRNHAALVGRLVRVQDDAGTLELEPRSAREEQVGALFFFSMNGGQRHESAV